MVDTCYAFGVRVVSVKTGQSGEWSLRFERILSQGMLICTVKLACGSPAI